MQRGTQAQLSQALQANGEIPASQASGQAAAEAKKRKAEEAPADASAAEQVCHDLLFQVSPYVDLLSLFAQTRQECIDVFCNQSDFFIDYLDCCTQ